MIEIVDKQFLKKRVTVWFPEKEYRTKQRCDVCCYVGEKDLIDKNNQHIAFNSLISDLDPDNEHIFASFSKVNRYDIRRSYKDHFTIIHHTADELSNNESFYNSYKSLYEKMYYKKGRKVEAPITAMKKYAKNNALLVSEVLIDREPIVYHAYIVDDKHARLWMSCSSFRDSEDKQYRALLGRANKRLHWEDMTYFKELGYKTYDWGGISSFEDPNGIDQFKMSFGGKHITYYDETVIVSLKYKMLYKIKNLLKR